MAYASTETTAALEMSAAAVRVIVRREDMLGLNRRPGERLRRREALEGVVGRVRASRRQTDVEVVGVRARARRKRAERGRAEAAERAVVDRASAVVAVGVDLQRQLVGKRRAAAGRAREGVRARE